MSIAERIGQLNERMEINARSTEFIQVARALCLRKATPEAVEEMRLPDRSARILKAAVALNNPAAATALADFRIVSNGFVEGLAQLSVFDRLLQDGAMRTVPLNARVFITTTISTGNVVGPATVKPLSEMTLSGGTVDPEKAVCIIIVSDELLKLTSAAAQGMFADALRQGVANATDLRFLSTLIAANAPIASAGATVANILTDIRALLAAITVNARSRLYFVLSPANLKALLTKTTSGGSADGRAFPNLTISGGEFGGLTVLASDQLSATQALLIDATGLVGGTEVVTLDASKYASLQMETSPSSPPVAATVLLSLWQENKTALRAERFFAYELLRTNAVASLSGVTY
jgi:HK97 family phage major capsid protein